LGGSGGDIGFAIAVDSGDNAYVTGTTSSTNFPTKTPEQAGSAGNGDAFVTKINSTGSALVYSTFIGGSGADFAYAIAVSAGDAFITGTTSSTDFPTASPTTPTAPTTPFQQTYGGNGDAFVTELNTTGNKLVFSSYLGGSGLDVGFGIAVDSSGNAYVTGYTQSANFPTTTTALQPTISGSQDAFVTKVNFTGEHILYSTFLGGSQANAAQTIQVDSSADMYVSGYTFSSDFPTQSPLQPTLAGGVNAFVAEIAAAGSPLVFSTYLGGSGNDRAYGLALDSSSNIYVTGTTTSTNFPTTSGAYQTSLLGVSNAFVSKLNPAGSALVYSTYLGGSETDQGLGIAVGSSGNAYVTGSTTSSNFPTVNAVQTVLGISAGALCGTGTCPDAFVTQLNAAGNGLVYSTYLGGSGYDTGQGIALDSTGDAYVTGSTVSTNFPAVATAYQSSLGGVAGNAFVAMINPANDPSIAFVPAKLNFGSETLGVTSPSSMVTVINAGTEPLVISSIVFNSSNSSSALTTTGFAETNNCVGTLAPSSAYCTIYVTFTPPSLSAQSDVITITDNNLNVTSSPLPTQTITVTGTGSTVATAVTVSPTTYTFPNQIVGTASAPQNVTITNTGALALNITKITTNNTDFSETDNCVVPPVNGILNPAQSCTVYVTFNPLGSGTRNGTLSISDNATGSPQSVALTGVGIAAFALTSPPTTPVLIGSTSANLTIAASTSTNFDGNITLLCPSSANTCSFNPSSIFAGQTSTLTISNLTTALANPYNFYVNGTSGSQTASVEVNLPFADYKLTATPALDTIVAGTTAGYTITISPLNQFNQQVSLSCATGTGTNFPPDATCTFTPSSPTLNGVPLNVALSIQTVKYIQPVPTHSPPRFPPGKLPPLILGVLSLLALASLALTSRRRARHGSLGSAWLAVRLATLSLILALDLTLGSCRSGVTSTGTVTGNYTITIYGTLVSNTGVVRSTTINLAVTPSS
jgi:hypothetical protein